MNREVRKIQDVQFQILSPPDGGGVLLEFVDEHDDAFMEINIDPAGARHVVFYRSSEHISIPLSELRRGLAIAESKVINIDPDALFRD